VIELFELSYDAISKLLIVYEYPVLYRSVLPHDWLKFFVLQFIFIQHLKYIIELGNSYKAIVLLINLLDSSNNLNKLVVAIDDLN
jgi:hypothetical protein